MSALLLETAAVNFEAAETQAGARQMGLIALGLKQLARGMKGGRGGLLLETAAVNFEAAEMQTGARQMGLIALGLKQLARGLKP
ncbi:MAG: hypothetical protein JNL07_03595 [Rhodospirillales bacterium]|nr:hypothetical protein [Rhodospirillales bacterium]